MSGAQSVQRGWWKKWLRQPGTRPFLALLLSLYGCALGADFIAPYAPRANNDAEPYHPPNVSFVDSTGRVHAWPVVRAMRRVVDDSGRRHYQSAIGSDQPLRLMVRGDEWTLRIPVGLRLELPLRLEYLKWRCDWHLIGGTQHARSYLLGADYRGRDLWSRILHGARISLTLSLVGVAISASIGIFVGGLSGYVGGWVDDVLQRVCEALMLLPGFYVLLALRGALPDTSRWSSTRMYATVIAIVSSIYWASLARSIRGQVLFLRSSDFVTAARALGSTTRRVLFRHLLPNTTSFAVVAATASIPGYILMESALSMLGLGIQEPEPSLGNLLSDAMKVSHLTEHPWILLPGVFLCVAVITFNVLGDTLRDAFDPRME